MAELTEDDFLAALEEQQALAEGVEPEEVPEQPVTQQAQEQEEAPAFTQWEDYKNDPRFVDLSPAQKQNLFDDWQNYATQYLAQSGALSTEDDVKYTEDYFTNIAKTDNLRKPIFDAPNYVMQLAQQAQSGFGAMEAGTAGYASALGMTDTATASDVISQKYREQRDMYVNPDLKKFTEDQLGFFGSAGRILTNPFDIALPLFTQSMASSAPAIALGAGAGAAGTLVGGPVGGLGAGLAVGGAASGVVDGVITFNQMVIEEVGKRGLDPANAQDVQSVLDDPKFVSDAVAYSAARGVVIGAAELATFGAGKYIAGAAKLAKASGLKKVGIGAAITGVETIGEGVGETGAQIAAPLATGKPVELQPGEIAAEMFVQAPGSIAIAGLQTARALIDANAPSSASEVTREAVQAAAEGKFEKVLGVQAQATTDVQKYYDGLSIAEKARVLGMAPNAVLTVEQGTFSSLTEEEKGKVQVDFDTETKAQQGPTVEEAEAKAREAFQPTEPAPAVVAEQPAPVAETPVPAEQAPVAAVVQAPSPTPLEIVQAKPITEQETAPLEQVAPATAQVVAQEELQAPAPVAETPAPVAEAPAPTPIVETPAPVTTTPAPVTPAPKKLPPTKKQVTALTKLGYLPADIEGLDRTQAKDIVTKQTPKTPTVEAPKEKAPEVATGAPAPEAPAVPPAPVSEPAAPKEEERAAGEVGAPVAPPAGQPTAPQAEQERLTEAEQKLQAKVGQVIAEADQLGVDEESVKAWLGPTPSDEKILRTRAVLRLLNLGLADVYNNIRKIAAKTRGKQGELTQEGGPKIKRVVFTTREEGAGLLSNPEDMNSLDVIYVNPDRLLSRLRADLTTDAADFFVKALEEELLHLQHGWAAFDLFAGTVPEDQVNPENFKNFFRKQSEEIEDSLTIGQIQEVVGKYAGIDTAGKTKEQLIQEFAQVAGRRGRLAEEYLRTLIQRRMLGDITEDKVRGLTPNSVLRSLGMIKNWLGKFVGETIPKKYANQTPVERYYNAVSDLIYGNTFAKIREARDEQGTAISGKQTLTASLDPMAIRKRFEQTTYQKELVKKINEDFGLGKPREARKGEIWAKTVGRLIGKFPTFKPNEVEAIVGEDIPDAVKFFDPSQKAVFSTYLYQRAYNSMLDARDKQRRTGIYEAGRVDVPGSVERARFQPLSEQIKKVEKPKDVSPEVNADEIATELEAQENAAEDATKAIVDREAEKFGDATYVLEEKYDRVPTPELAEEDQTFEELRGPKSTTGELVAPGLSPSQAAARTDLSKVFDELFASFPQEVLPNGETASREQDVFDFLFRAKEMENPPTRQGIMAKYNLGHSRQYDRIVESVREKVANTLAENNIFSAGQLSASVDPVELAKQRGIKTEITKLSDLYNFPARFTNTQEMEADGIQVEKFASAMSKIQKLGIVPDPTMLNFLQAYENKIDWNKIKTPQDLYAYAETLYGNISEIQNYRVSPKDINFSLEENALVAVALFNEDARKALEAYRQNKEQNQLKILDYINTQRIESVREWYNEIDDATGRRNLVPAFNAPFAKVLLWSIPDTALKAKKAGGSTIASVSSLVQTVLNKMNENGLKTINVEKLYRKMLTDMAAQNVVEKVEVAPGKEWVYIPSKSEDQINFKSNVEKLKQLSASSWCTRSFNAEPYLQQGGFWILIDNQKPLIAVRKVGSEVREIQDVQNTGIKPIPDDLWNDTVSFLKKRDLYSSAIPIIRQAGRLSGDDLLKVISTAKNITELEAYLRDYQLSSIASPEVGTMIWSKTKELIQKEKDQYVSSQEVNKTPEYVEDLYAPKVGQIVKKLIIPPSADKQFVLPNSEVATDIFNYLNYLQGVRQEFKTERPTTFGDNPTFIYDFEATPVFSPEQKRALARGYLFGNENSYDPQFSESSFLTTEDLNELVRHVNDQDLGPFMRHFRYRPIVGNTNSNLDTLKFIIDSNPSYSDPDDAGLKIELYNEAMVKSRTAAPYAFLGGKGLTTERKDYEKHLAGLTSLIANDFDAMSTKVFSDLMLYLESNQMDLLVNSIVSTTPPGKTNDVLESVLQKLLDNDVNQKQIYKFFAAFPQDESGVIKKTIEKVANNIMGRNELTIYTVEKLTKIFSLYSSWYDRSQDLVSQQTAKDILSTFASYLRSEEVSRNGVERIFESAILPWKTLQEKALQRQTEASPLFVEGAKEFDQRNAIYNSLSASKTFKELLNNFDRDFKSTASEKMDILSFLPTRSLGDPDIVDKLLSYGATVLKEKKESGVVGNDGNIDALLFEANSLVRRARREQKPFDRIKYKDLVDRSITLLTDYAKFLAPKVETLIATKGVPRLYLNTEDLFAYGVEGYLRAANLAFDIMFSDTITQQQREELTEVIGKFPPIAARQFLDSMAPISFWKQDALNTFEDVQRAFKKTSGKNMGELLNEFFDTNYGKTILSVSESGKQKSFPTLQILLGENSEQKTKALEALTRYSANVFSKFLTPSYLKDINLSAELSFSGQGLEAFYDPSQAELVFVLDNIASEQRGRQLFFHEATHGNVAYLKTDEQGKNELNQILNSARNELMENAEYLANRAGFTSFDQMKVSYGFKNDTEMLGELLARYAEDLETRVEPSWFTKIIRDLIGWFKRNLGLDFNREDLLNWLSDRMQRAATGERLVAGTQEPAPILASLAKETLTASVDPMATQALRRSLLSVPEDISKLLRARTYFPYENKELLQKANDFVDANAGENDIFQAKIALDRATETEVSNPQRIITLGVIGKRLKDALYALDQKIKKEGNTPELEALRNKYSTDLYDVLSVAQDILSSSGQDLQAGRVFANLFTPEQMVRVYTKPIADAQKKLLAANAEIQKLKALIQQLKNELAAKAVGKVVIIKAPEPESKFYDFLGLFGDLEPNEQESFQEYLTRIGIDYPALMAELETTITASVDPVTKNSPLPKDFRNLNAREAIKQLVGLDKNFFSKLVNLRVKTGAVAITAEVATAQTNKGRSQVSRKSRPIELQMVFDFFNTTEAEKPTSEEPIEKDSLPLMVRLAKYASDSVTDRVLKSLGVDKKTTPKGLFDAMEKQVRKYVNAQFREEMDPQKTSVEDTRTPEQKLTDLVERIGLAEQIFNQTKANLQARLDEDTRLRAAKVEGQMSDADRAALQVAVNRTFDAGKIVATAKEVRQLVDFKAEARKHISQRGATVGSLSRLIKEKLPNLNDAQVKALADLITANYNRLVKDSGASQLNNILKRSLTKASKQPKKEIDQMLELMNLGAFNEEKFYNAIADRFGLPTWDPEVVAEIKKRGEAVERLPQGSDQRTVASLQLQGFIAQKLKEQAKGYAKLGYVLDVMGSVWKAGVLSGFGTQSVNLLSTGGNVGLELVTSAIGYITTLAVDNKIRVNPGKFIYDIISTYIDNLGRVAPQEAMDAFATGFGRLRSENQKQVTPLEAFSVDTKLPKGAKATAKWTLNNYLGLWKLVGRAMAAADTFNANIAHEAKLRMQMRYLLMSEKGMTSQQADEIMKDLFSADSDMMTGIREQVDREAEAGQFGTLEGIDPKSLAYRVQNRKIEAGKRRRLAQLREQQIATEVSGDNADETVQGIKRFTEVATFNNNPTGLLGYIGDRIAQLGAGFPLLQPFTSFTRTVANVVNASLNYTPYGFFRLAGGSLGNLRKNKGGKYEFESPEGVEFYKLATQATLGTLTLYALNSLFWQDMDDPWDKAKFAVTGLGPSDPNKRAQLRASGWAENSVKVTTPLGPLQFRHSDIPGLSLVLGGLGMLSDSYRYGSLKEADKTTLAAYMAASLGSVVFEKNLLSGAKSLFDILKLKEDPVAALQRGAGQYVGGITNPGAFRWLAQTVGVNDRGMVEQIDQRKLNSTVPGFLLGLTPVAIKVGSPKLNRLGEPVEEYPWTASTKRIGFFPEVKPHPVLSPLVGADLFVPGISRLTKINVYRKGRPEQVRVDITEDTYYDYAKYNGQYLRRVLTPARARNLANRARVDREGAQDELQDLATQAKKYAVDRIEAQIRTKGLGQ